jgi:hypothetical protein
MTVIIINKEEYISSDVLFEKAPVYCKLSRSGRDLIKKKKITDYIFAKLINKVWCVSDGKSYKYDKIFIKKSFYDTIPEVKQDKVIVDDNNIPLAPDIIYLDDSEKFKDENGVCVEIETRGTRKVDSIYFKVKDVSISFKLERLDDIILNKQKHGYIENIHYKYFNCKKPIRDVNKTNKIKTIIKKELYLTYEGILRVLFASRSHNVKPFIKWATETLFVVQMGTPEQKQTLSASLLGLNTQTIKDVFNSSSNKTPTVYLFNIGSANQLLKTDIYKDDDILCKYGCTDDISRRTSEHERNFKKQYNVDITLLLYSIIDPQYIFDAETNIRQYFKSNKISSDDKSELIVINNKNINQIKQHYKMIQNSYIGRYEEINNKIIELEKHILKLKHQLELKDKDLELKQKDVLLANQKNELLEMKLLMLKTHKSGLLIKK